jgi:hypothetical protein
LRSACEALIEERLFAGTIHRYDDHIKVQNLEEVVFDQFMALKIIELHGKMPLNFGTGAIPALDFGGNAFGGSVTGESLHFFESTTNIH